MSESIELRTGAWYGDRALRLEFPQGWSVTTFWPSTPRPLSDRDIAAALEHPVGQVPIRQLASGKHRPLVIVDDLTRPTPASRVMPILLRQLDDAGIPARDVRILIATGTHGAPAPGGAAKKVGAQAAESCQILVHDQRHRLERIGRTSFGTPVVVNRAVLESDLLVGVAGVYPQYNTGFGGGSKLALGVLGRRSITALHYGHKGVEGSHSVENDFRKDLDQIARMIGLRSIVTLHVDANRDIVRVHSGDHFQYYAEAVRFAKDQYWAPAPREADVVVSNAYPSDISLTFMRSKGMLPLFQAGPNASRIVIAQCPEGIGDHGLFPFMNVPRLQRQIHLARRISVMNRAEIPRAILQHVLPKLPAAVRPRPTHASPGTMRLPIWLYPAQRSAGALPASIPEVRTLYAWSEVLAQVRSEQRTRTTLRVLVYPCAPLQVLAR
jgi:nickel-dependent lactate racemase